MMFKYEEEGRVELIPASYIVGVSYESDPTPLMSIDDVQHLFFTITLELNDIAQVHYSYDSELMYADPSLFVVNKTLGVNKKKRLTYRTKKEFVNALRRLVHACGGEV